MPPYRFKFRRFTFILRAGQTSRKKEKLRFRNRARGSPPSHPKGHEVQSFAAKALVDHRPIIAASEADPKAHQLSFDFPLSRELGEGGHRDQKHQEHLWVSAVSFSRELG